MRVKLAEDDLTRLRNLLAAAVRLQALPISELERRLGLGRGQLGRMLNGRTEIKVSLLLRLLEAIDMAPGTFFRQVFPAETGSGRMAGSAAGADRGAGAASAARAASGERAAAGAIGSTARGGEAPGEILERLHEMIGLPPPRRAGAGARSPRRQEPLAPLTDAELDERLDEAFARFWGAEGKAGGKAAGGSGPAGVPGRSQDSEEKK